MAVAFIRIYLCGKLHLVVVMGHGSNAIDGVINLNNLVNCELFEILIFFLSIASCYDQFLYTIIE